MIRSWRRAACREARAGIARLATRTTERVGLSSPLRPDDESPSRFAGIASNARSGMIYLYEELMMAVPAGTTGLGGGVTASWQVGERR